MRKLRSNNWKITLKGAWSEYTFSGVDEWRDKIACFENRYQEGNGRINILKDVVIILWIGGVISGVDLSFIPWQVFIIFAVFWVWGCYTLGYISEKWGWWKNRAKHLSGTIDPNIKQILENTKEIKDKLKL